MNRKEIKSYEEKKVQFLNDVEAGKYNTQTGDISQAKVKKAYKDFFVDAEKNYYHALVADRSGNGTSINTKAMVQKFAPGNWEDLVDTKGAVIRKGMKSSIEKTGSILIVLHDPDTLTEEAGIVE